MRVLGLYQKRTFLGIEILNKTCFIGFLWLQFFGWTFWYLKWSFQKMQVYFMFGALLNTPIYIREADLEIDVRPGWTTNTFVPIVYIALLFGIHFRVAKIYH